MIEGQCGSFLRSNSSILKGIKRSVWFQICPHPYVDIRRTTSQTNRFFVLFIYTKSLLKLNRWKKEIFIQKYQSPLLNHLRRSVAMRIYVKGKKRKNTVISRVMVCVAGITRLIKSFQPAYFMWKFSFVLLCHTEKQYMHSFSLAQTTCTNDKSD